MLSFEVLTDRYAICRLSPDDPIPPWAVRDGTNEQSFISLTWTPDELSIVCRESSVPGHVESEPDWTCIRVAGKLDFALVGILSEITKHLAEAGISVFALSTFDTDYLLIKSPHWPLAEKTLSNAGYAVYPLKQEA